ncbi:hypothetical protein BZA05DRAFT_409942 [Tricharina praecox]|uniref:uncharacterized protein n=1 Tax=Tricharina praecox TaxID=43433 RepID=UPI002220A1CA|nr:uncharacterized protein BZA05DRAFT_409942 [Tricharina praecox]KAI5844108.1 hypothetical protein BZA05DRAFT_409942 [Tricharina praecox]
MLRAADELLTNRKRIAEQLLEIADLKENNKALRSQLSEAQAQNPVMNQIPRSIGDFASAAIPAKRKAGSPEGNGRRLAEFRMDKPQTPENNAAIPRLSDRGQVFRSPQAPQRLPTEELVHDDQRPRERLWQDRSQQEQDSDERGSSYQRYMQERLQQHYTDQRPSIAPSPRSHPSQRPSQFTRNVNRPFQPPGRAQAPHNNLSHNNISLPGYPADLELDITPPRSPVMAPPSRSGYIAPSSRAGSNQPMRRSRNYAASEAGYSHTSARGTSIRLSNPGRGSMAPPASVHGLPTTPGSMGLGRGNHLNRDRNMPPPDTLQGQLRMQDIKIIAEQLTLLHPSGPGPHCSIGGLPGERIERVSRWTAGNVSEGSPGPLVGVAGRAEGCP